MVEADMLAVYPPAEVDALLARRVVTRSGGDAARDLLDATAATHLLRLSNSPPRLLAEAVTNAERLRDYEQIEPQLRDTHFSPEWLLDQLLYGMPFTRLDESPVGFDCWCDDVRLMGALASLGRTDIEHLLEGGEVLEIRCEYCGKEYRVPPAQLRGLLDAS